MLFKILTLAGAALSIYFMARRFFGPAAPDQPPAKTPPQPPKGPDGKGRAVEDLVECPRCGAFHPASDICDCERAPIP